MKCRGHTAEQRDRQPGPEQRQRPHQQRASGTLDPVREPIEREGRRRHESADESPSRLVVTAQQQEDGKEEEQGHQEAGRGPKNRRRRRLGLWGFAIGALGGCEPKQRADARVKPIG